MIPERYRLPLLKQVEGDVGLPFLDRRANRTEIAVDPQDPDLVAQALSPVTATVRCASLGEAVSRAFAAAEPGDTVLLAPGCSSFDMFRDYADRGRAFKAEARRLDPSLAQASLPGPSGAAERLAAAGDGGAYSLG